MHSPFPLESRDAKRDTWSECFPSGPKPSEEKQSAYKIILAERKNMRIQRFAFLFIFILVICTSAFADDWEKYSEFADKFYYLDKQPFEKISCQIKLSTLDITRKQLSVLTSTSDAIKVSEDFDNFTLTMDRDRNITFNRPSLDIEVVSGEKNADLEKMNSQIKYMKDGFQMQIDGAVVMLKELLEGIFLPRKDEYSNLTFRQEKDGTIKVAYKKDNFDVTEVYKDAVVSQTAINSKMNSEGKIYFQELKGKLIVRKLDGKVKIQDASEINTEITVEYQELGSIILPEKLNVKTKMGIPGQNFNLEGDFNIMLTNCKIN